MRLLIDQNVPDAVADVFRERGHDVVLARDALVGASPDALAATAADLHGAVVVTADKDLTAFRKLLPEGMRRGFTTRAGHLHVAAPEEQAVDRLRDEIELIEGYAARADQQGMRLLVRLGVDTILLGLVGKRGRRRET